MTRKEELLSETVRKDALVKLEAEKLIIELHKAKPTANREDWLLKYGTTHYSIHIRFNYLVGDWVDKKSKRPMESQVKLDLIRTFTPITFMRAIKAYGDAIYYKESGFKTPEYTSLGLCHFFYGNYKIGYLETKMLLLYMKSYADFGPMHFRYGDLEPRLEFLIKAREELHG